MTIYPKVKSDKIIELAEGGKKYMDNINDVYTENIQLHKQVIDLNKEITRKTNIIVGLLEVIAETKDESLLAKAQASLARTV